MQNERLSPRAEDYHNKIRQICQWLSVNQDSHEAQRTTTIAANKLLKMFQDESPETQAYFRKDVYLFLLEKLASENVDKPTISDLLSRIVPDERILPKIIEHASEGNYYVQHAAMSAISAILKNNYDEDSGMSLLSDKIIGEIVNLLPHLLRSNKTNLITLAITIIRQIGDQAESTIPDLIKLIFYNDPLICGMVLDALGRFGKKAKHAVKSIKQIQFASKENNDSNLFAAATAALKCITGEEA